MMPPETDYYNILEQCIAAVLSEQATIQQCLDAYPQYASALEPELTVAVLTNRLKSPVMSEKAVDTLEARLMQQFSTAPTLQSANRNHAKVVQFPFMQPLSRAAAVVAVVVMLAVGSGGAVIAASADDLPGEPLYGVKRFWESVILFFASLIGQSDDVWLHLAQTRFHELTVLYSRGDANTEAYDDLHNAVMTAIEHADSTTTPDLVDFMERSYQIITTQMQPTALFVQAQARVLRILVPHYDTDGRLSLPPEDGTDTTSRPLAEATMTYTPTQTPTEMVTESPTPTVTNTPSPTVTATSTSRIPPTPTRTPTLTPSPTVTTSPVPTATYTWTPLPLPDGSQPGDNTTQPTPDTYQVGEGTPFPTQSGIPDYWIRQTQQSVYMTQTAVAGTNETEEPAPPGE